MSESPSRPPFRREALLLGGLHLAVATWYWAARGVTIVHDPWSRFWQNIPADLLRHHALQSLWYLHAQPPLWNVLGAILVKVFGSAQLPALQACHILLGAATATLCALLVARLTGSRGWGWAGGLLVALHPALVLYEAYALYTVAVAFGVVLATWLLHVAAERASPAWALGFVAAVVGLILTRSLFHVVLLAAVVPLGLVAGGRPSGRQTAVLVALVLLPLGWYGKNLAQYGFFGGSSWYGMGLWRTVRFRQDPDELRSLFDAGRLDPVVRLAPYSRPVAYRPLGYVATSPVPLLDRDDFHNVNIPAISAAYARSARTLILHDPVRYVENVLVGYGNFSGPSSDFAHLQPNRLRMGEHAELDRWLTGRPVVQALEGRLGFYLGSLYFFVIPLALGGWAIGALGGLRSAAEPSRVLRAEAAPAFIALIVAYTAVVGCAMELGENIRFKFLVEPAFLVLLNVVVHRLVAWRGFRNAHADVTIGHPPLQ